MAVDITPYVGSIVTIVVAIVGGYVAMKNANNQKFNELSIQIATVTTEVRDLRKDVEKHNNLVERTAGLERDLNTAFKHIDNQRDELRRLDEKKADK